MICVLNEPGHAKVCLMPYANKKGADPAHPRSLISTFIVRYLDSMILAISEVSRFQLVSVAEQTGLNLIWSKIPLDTFLRDLAQMIKELVLKAGFLKLHCCMYRF